jgi:signal transduction histidine kinase
MYLNLCFDAVRLKQIIVNLIANALKFTEESIQLTMEIASDDDAISTIKFSVKDTGMGIKKQNQEKIFHSFCKKIFLLLENLVEQV